MFVGWYVIFLKSIYFSDRIEYTINIQITSFWKTMFFSQIYKKIISKIRGLINKLTSSKSKYNFTGHLKKKTKKHNCNCFSKCKNKKKLCK